MSPQTWIVAAVGCAAMVDDLARRRISNWIPLVALLSGFAVHGMETGWRGALSAAAGASTGGALFLFFYLLGGLGGGDIKLMAGLGSLLGASLVLEAALWTAGCGGVIAAAVIAFRAVRRFWNQRRRAASGIGVEPSPELDSIPYAPAIAIGAWLSLISHAPSTPGLG
jgi:prepilin peptidase CpaA